MPRVYNLNLKDIIDSIKIFERYIQDLDYTSFIYDGLVINGVIRNSEITCQTIKQIPSIILKKKETEMRKIAGLREILIHAYFGVDLDIIWDISQNKLLPLNRAILELIKDVENKPNNQKCFLLFLSLCKQTVFLREF